MASCGLVYSPMHSLPEGKALSVNCEHHTTLKLMSISLSSLVYLLFGLFSINFLYEFLVCFPLCLFKIKRNMTVFMSDVL